MPDYTRIYYRRASTEVLVQEFPPQTRFLKFQGSLASRANTEEEMSNKDATKTHSFSLGLPYTVFIFRFVDGMFNQVQCAFSDRPLKALDEIPLRPYFTNIGTNLEVCLGGDLNRDKLEKNNITQQSAYVLDHFWQSIFSDEWGTHFWNTRSHFLQSGEDRLSTLQKWEDATMDDPLFVVENVDWLKFSDDNFGDMIVRNFEIGSKGDLEFQEAIYKEIVDKFFQKVKESVGNSVDNVIETLSKMDISKELEKHL